MEGKVWMGIARAIAILVGSYFGIRHGWKWVEERKRKKKEEKRKQEKEK